MGTLYKKTNTDNWVFSYRKEGKNIRVMGEEHGLNNLGDLTKKEKGKLKYQLEEKYQDGTHMVIKSMGKKVYVIYFSKDCIFGLMARVFLVILIINLI